MTITGNDFPVRGQCRRTDCNRAERRQMSCAGGNTLSGQAASGDLLRSQNLRGIPITPRGRSLRPHRECRYWASRRGETCRKQLDRAAPLSHYLTLSIVRNPRGSSPLLTKLFSGTKWETIINLRRREVVCTRQLSSIPGLPGALLWAASGRCGASEQWGRDG
jgi:hypothetical protein